MPGRGRSDLNGSRTTNTSTNVSPSFNNDNNSRTVLLGSDDLRTPDHRASNHNNRNRVQKITHHQIRNDNDNSNYLYDEVVSHSTLDDGSPQTSSEDTVDDSPSQTSTSESTSASEAPSESRFKTFVKKKKNKTVVISNNNNNIITSNYNGNGNGQALENDTNLWDSELDSELPYNSNTTL